MAPASALLRKQSYWEGLAGARWFLLTGKGNNTILALHSWVLDTVLRSTYMYQIQLDRHKIK